ncbi:hypothetical protein MCOR25_004079 [Pyricularia grisea]|nr:hypothetical protein MCOR25_004079 [Pyricularia grisea]
MSQESAPSRDAAGPTPSVRSNGEGSSGATNETQSPGPSGPPSYMTVGTGSTSEHAHRLQALLDNDSGYGGSIAGDGAPLIGASGDHHQALVEPDRRMQTGAIHQLYYNSHRVALARSINLAIQLLKGLREMNAKWPAHYPSVQGIDTPASPRPGNLRHSFTSIGDLAASAPAASHPRELRRSLTSVEDIGGQDAESSKAAERRQAPAEPRLVSPQISREFSILKLDLKLGSLHQAELVHSLEKGSVASLLDGKIGSSIKHLQSLRERIEDTSSKVLVTGDLNAGKSAFCNALLRRKILPEDQQPCTSIFCEVLDARENSGLEEVHAVHKEAIYDRNDESTYDVYSLSDLEKIVIDNETYLQCKVYVKDVRTIDESLLNNGVVDIALIDAPGLNSEMTKTTAVFARQEEIDVVVFVVSAANHFTISAQDFISVAAAEKAYLFIVVNQFDNIRDKERCQKMILDRVKMMSPRTYKEASELVHFVSSNAVPVAPPPPPPGGSGGSGSSSGGGGGDGDDDPHEEDSKGKGKGKDKEKIRDFENLEQSLRRFVLEKRSRSKLAPAKNYLLNILADINALAQVNVEVAQSELDRVNEELAEIEPMLESGRKASAQVDEQMDKSIEQTCSEVYEHTRSTLGFTIQNIGDADLGVHYPGIWGSFDYAEQLKEAMLAQISDAVAACEDHARARTVSGVNTIKQLGLLHLGDEYADLSFRPDVMFRRKRDVLARQADIPTEIWDFIDWNTLIRRQEKVAGTGMALTVATAVGGQLVVGYGWMDHALRAARVLGNDNLRRLIIPGIVVAAVAASAFVLNSIPQSLPHRLSAKVSSHLAATDYVHLNSARISGSVRKVLRIPADSVRVGLRRSVEQLGTRRDETLRISAESAVALKYFSNLVRDSAKHRATIDEVDLEAHGAA